MKSLDEAGPDVAWDLYRPFVETAEEMADPVLAFDVEGLDEVVVLTLTDLVPGDMEGSLAKYCAKVLALLVPVRVLFSAEVWTRLADDVDEDRGMGEAVAIIYTSRSESEWIASAPFVRTREGVHWHEDEFWLDRSLGDKADIILNTLRSFVGRSDTSVTPPQEEA